ncbi:MAG: hypothetical protein J6A59_07125, partial [Lachnospiraceae bacterium]|nr:hypothetical protein [Lachnospiraceae bacterium]
MKQRTDYVTNSSSSSFIFDNKELGIEGVFNILKDYCKDVIEIIDNTISQIKSEDEDLYNKIIKINKLYEEERIAYDKYLISESLKEHGKVITSRYDWGELIDLDEYNNVKSEYDIEKIRETYGNVDNKPDEYLSMKNEINQRCYELEDE